MTTTAQALTRRNRQTHENEIFSHTVSKDFLSGHKPRTNLPNGFKDGTIICLADVNTERLEGKAILVQEPKKGLSPHDWQNPEFHGKLIPGGFVGFKNCLRVNGNGNGSKNGCGENTQHLYYLLKKHFTDEGFFDLGWRPIENERGQITHLIIQSHRQAS